MSYDKPVKKVLIVLWCELEGGEWCSNSWLPAMTQLPQTTVRSKMDDPANKPIPLIAYSFAVSLLLTSPETDHTK